ncbi:MAG: hypothetical protein ACLRL6_10580 [Clostridium sp.]
MSIQQKDHTVGTEKKVDEKEQALSSTYSTGVALSSIIGLKDNNTSASVLQRELNITLKDKSSAVLTMNLNLQSIQEASGVMFRILPIHSASAY